MKKILAFITIFALLAGFASAIEQTRTHTFSIGESATYHFLGEEYTIRLMGKDSGAQGKVEIYLNDDRKTVSANYPFIYGSFMINVKEITSQEATLELRWFKNNVEPDAEQYVTMNTKQVINVNDKLFNVLFNEVNSDRVATVKINDETFKMSEWDKVVLEDESEVRLDSISGTSVKRLDLEFWASEEDGTYQSEEEFDAERRIGLGQVETIEMKGLRIQVEVLAVSSSNQVTIDVEGEEATISEGETVTLNNSFEVHLVSAAAKAPKGAVIKINIPDDLQRESTHVNVRRNLKINQKDEFESEGKTINTWFKSKDKDADTAVMEFEGEEYIVKQGDVLTSDGIEATITILNTDLYPAKAVIDYLIEKKPEPEPAVEEEDETETESQEATEVPEETEEVSEKDDITNEEIPEYQVPEETEEKKEETEGGFMKTVKNVGNSISNFFNWLVGN